MRAAGTCRDACAPDPSAAARPPECAMGRVDIFQRESGRGPCHRDRQSGLSRQLGFGDFKDLLGRGAAVVDPAFSLVTLLLEKRVVEFQCAAEGGGQLALGIGLQFHGRADLQGGCGVLSSDVAPVFPAPPYSQ